jgi:hypothetical protein
MFYLPFLVPVKELYWSAMNLMLSQLPRKKNTILLTRQTGP